MFYLKLGFFQAIGLLWSFFFFPESLVWKTRGNCGVYQPLEPLHRTIIAWEWHHMFWRSSSSTQQSDGFLWVFMFRAKHHWTLPSKGRMCGWSTTYRRHGRPKATTVRPILRDWRWIRYKYSALLQPEPHRTKITAWFYWSDTHSQVKQWRKTCFTCWESGLEGENPDNNGKVLYKKSGIPLTKPSFVSQACWDQPSRLKAFLHCWLSQHVELVRIFCGARPTGRRVYLWHPPPSIHWNKHRETEANSEPLGFYQPPLSFLNSLVKTDFSVQTKLHFCLWMFQLECWIFLIKVLLWSNSAPSFHFCTLFIRYGR